MATRKTGAALMAAPAAGTVSVRFPFAPVPASRPRVSRWGVYYSKTYKDWMKEADRTVPEAKAPMYGPLRVDVELVCKRPQKLTRAMPVGDVDNYAKAVLDALTKKGYWPDDDEITELLVEKRYALAGEEPHTNVTIRVV